MAPELLKSRTGRTLVESHRGIEGPVPENSWPALKLGVQSGADLLEMDVQASSDGIPFLRHNYRLPDGRWCSQLPWSELNQVLIEDEPLPLLEDVLVWARDKGVILSLDIKTMFHPEGKLTVEVVRSLERTGAGDQVLLLFVDHEELLNLKCLHPGLAVRALLTGRLVDYAGYLKKIHADCASLSYGMFRPEDVEKIHAAGISVVLTQLWNLDAGIFSSLEIDIFSHGDPVEARRILGYPQDH
jgi:glycerophosphoryl diester phosphodiesterase